MGGSSPDPHRCLGPASQDFVRVDACFGTRWQQLLGRDKKVGRRRTQVEDVGGRTKDDPRLNP